MRAACRVVLTRAPGDNARLRAALSGVDADVVDYPCIAIEPLPLPDEAIHRLSHGDYATVFFVSRNAVEHLLSRVQCSPPAHVVALGKGTVEALQEYGWPVSAQPSDAYMECVLRELSLLVPAEGRVLSVRGVLGRDVFVDAIRARGQAADEIIVYNTIDGVQGPLPTDDRPTLLTFASPSAVRHFTARNPAAGHAITIGETTAQAARSAGFQVTVAPSSDLQALATSVREWAAQFRGEAACST